MKPPVDIYLVGLGIAGVWHLTREAEACLGASRHVFTIDPNFGVREHVEGLGATVHDLLGEYQDASSRMGTYRRMAAKVVAAAMAEPPVCLAAYGHPTLFVYPSVLIRRTAELLGLTVYTAPGISSLDTMLVDLDLDPVFNGLQIYDASAMLVENRRLDPEVPCLLLQPDAVESVFHSVNRNRASRFVRLRDHLLRFHPGDHVVTMVRSSTFAGFDPAKTSFAIGELPEVFEEQQPAGSLYIPPSRTAEYDEELTRLTFDPLHVNRITYPPPR